MQATSERLKATVGYVIRDLEGAANAALVTLGDRPGLYTTLHEIGPATGSELAEATGTNERYVRE